MRYIWAKYFLSWIIGCALCWMHSGISVGKAERSSDYTFAVIHLGSSNISWKYSCELWSNCSYLQFASVVLWIQGNPTFYALFYFLTWQPSCKRNLITIKLSPSPTFRCGHEVAESLHCKFCLDLEIFWGKGTQGDLINGSGMSRAPKESPLHDPLGP